MRDSLGIRTLGCVLLTWVGVGMSRTLALDPWQSSLLVRVWLLRVCAENVHHGSRMFLAWRLLTCRDCSYWDELSLLLVQLYILTLSPCLSVCNNSSSLSSCLQPFKHLTHTLSFWDAAASSSENPVHPIPAFLCVCLSSFTLLVWPKSPEPCKGWGKTQSQKLNSSGVNLQCCHSVSSTLTSKVTEIHLPLSCD